MRRALPQLIVPAALLLAAGAAAQTPPASWATRCEQRLDRARAELARAVPWAARGQIEIVAMTTPISGWLVHYESRDGRLSALIEDYPGTTAEPWVIAGRGECFDESVLPPDLSLVRNYPDRQAQLRVDRAPPAARRAISRVLRTALDECASY